MNSTFALPLALSLLLLAGCTDNSSSDIDINAPAVTISTPAEGSAISGIVNIKGHVTDESLHAMSIIVTDDTDGAPLFTAKPSIHAKTEYFFDENWTPSVSADKAVTLTVSVEDHSNHTTVKTVHFTVKP